MLLHPGKGGDLLNEIDGFPEAPSGTCLGIEWPSPGKISFQPCACLRKVGRLLAGLDLTAAPRDLGRFYIYSIACFPINSKRDSEQTKFK